MGYRANSEIVFEAWLRGVTGVDPNKLGSTLPQDQAWADTGFIQFAVVGGVPDLDNPIRKPVFGLDFWAISPTPGSNKPPWWQANNLAETVLAGCYNDANPAAGGRDVSAVLQAAHPQYDGARVLSVYSLSEPRRVYEDISSYARYTMDVLCNWVRKAA